MAYQKLPNRSFFILSGFFTLVYLSIVGYFLYIAARPQCPVDVTEQQIQDTGCIVGANIGAGMLFYLVLFLLVFMLPVWIFTIGRLIRIWKH